MASKIKVDTLETANGSGSITLNNPIAGFTSTGIDDNATSNAITIDANENVLVGKTSSSTTTAGNELRAGGLAAFTRSGSYSLNLNRLSSDGDIAVFQKDNTSVGSIGATGGNAYINSNGGTFKISTNGTERYNFDADQFYPATDNAQNIGLSSLRYKDLYLSGNANCERVNTTHDGDWGMEMKGVTSARIRFHTSAGGSGQVGAITVSTSSTNYAVNSDYRLKEDDVPMTGATERVKALRPINFAWKVDGSRVDGFFAHEAQEVVPEAVTGTKDAMMDEEYEVTPATETEAAVMGTRSVPDMQGIDQSKLVPLLTATIQELIARIEALENV